MPSPPSLFHQSDIDIWLAELGFRRGNPFVTVEAEQERLLLPDFFIHVDGYERVRGEESVVVFAPRGGGKSALRVMLASYAAPIMPESDLLAVEYTDFEPLIAQWRSGQPIDINCYVFRLMRAGSQALFDTFFKSSFSSQRTDAQTDVLRRAQRAARFPAYARLRLANLMRAYHPNLLDVAAIHEILSLLEPTCALSLNRVTQASSQRSLHQLFSTVSLQNHPIAVLLADITDAPDLAQDAASTSKETLAALVRLAQAAGFASIQFLVDRLDEYAETADNPAAQADILEPLLASLHLLELSGVAFKFFLSREARDVLLQRGAIRRDRLTDKAVTVQWQASRLKKMLDQRLMVFSDNRVHELSMICDDAYVQPSKNHEPVRLDTWLEAEMLNFAYGSPRRLLIAAQLLCEAHIQRVGATGRLEAADWEAAKAQLMHKIPPILHLWRSERRAQIGEQVIKLSKQEHAILMTLAGNQGECEREFLADAVWGTGQGVSNEAIDKALVRLRWKLGDDAASSLFLKTIRGEGIVLSHYAIA